MLVAGQRVICWNSDNLLFELTADSTIVLTRSQERLQLRDLESPAIVHRLLAEFASIKIVVVRSANQRVRSPLLQILHSSRIADQSQDVGSRSEPRLSTTRIYTFQTIISITFHDTLLHNLNFTILRISARHSKNILSLDQIRLRGMICLGVFRGIELVPSLYKDFGDYVAEVSDHIAASAVNLGERTDRPRLSL